MNCLSKDGLIRIRREFHRIPELGFEEYKTSKLILDYLRKWKKEYINIKQWKTGIVVFVKGKIGEKEYGFRCDIDGLPLQEDTGLEFSSENEGEMHACGHDFHITFGLSLVYFFSKNRPKHNYWIVFQPAEEGPGGAEPMIKEFSNDWKNVDHFFALHMDPTLKTGVVGYNHRKLFAGTQEIDIILRSNGGHAAFPEEVKDLNAILSRLYLDLKEIQDQMNRNDKEVIIHFGKIDSGDVRNSFPIVSVLKGTIRSFDETKTKQIIEKIINWLEEEGVLYEIVLGSKYKPVINEKRLVDEFVKVAENVTITKQIPPRFTGEDFGYFSEMYPTFMFWLGSESQYGLHENKLNLDEEALAIGQAVLLEYITYLERK